MVSISPGGGQRMEASPVVVVPAGPSFTGISPHTGLEEGRSSPSPTAEAATASASPAAPRAFAASAPAAAPAPGGAPAAPRSRNRLLAALLPPGGEAALGRALGLGLPGAARSRVRYPHRFKILMVMVVFAGFMWVCNYVAHVLPTIEDHVDTPCKYNDSQLTYNAKMLFVYFLWLALARASLFLPCVATRVALVQSRTHGFCRTYCVHLVIRDGPLYIFVVGSMLFWFHLMQSSACEERSPILYRTLQLYAVYSCMISILCLLLAYWHNRLLIDAAREFHEGIVEDRSAPAGTLERLPTRRYDPAVFGDEEGMLYPSECAICLGTWEENDVIKVTPCQHAFHEECIGNWFQSARTCALCRQDLAKPPNSTSNGGNSPASSPGVRSQPDAQVLGAGHGPEPGPEGTPGTPGTPGHSAAASPTGGAGAAAAGRAGAAADDIV